MSDNNEIEIAKIEELFAQWDSAVETSNLDGYIDGLDENITLMPPGGVVIKGRENYRKFLGPVFESATYTVTNLSLIHISEPTRPLYISYAVFCLKKK